MGKWFQQTLQKMRYSKRLMNIRSLVIIGKHIKTTRRYYCKAIRIAKIKEDLLYSKCCWGGGVVVWIHTYGWQEYEIVKPHGETSSFLNV